MVQWLLKLWTSSNKRPWEIGNKRSAPYTCPSLLHGESFWLRCSEWGAKERTVASWSWGEKGICVVRARRAENQRSIESSAGDFSCADQHMFIRIWPRSRETTLKILETRNSHKVKDSSSFYQTE